MPIAKESLGILLRMRFFIKKEFGTMPALDTPDLAEQCYAYGARSKQPALIQLTRELEAFMPHASSQADVAGTTSIVSAEPIHHDVPTRPATSSAISAMALLLRMRPLIRQEFGLSLVLNNTDALQIYYKYGKKSQQPELYALATQLESYLSTLPRAPASPAPLVPLTAPRHPQAVVLAIGQAASTALLELLASDILHTPTRLSCPEVPEFIIDKPQQRCVLQGLLTDLAPLGQADLSLVQCQPATSAEIQEMARLGTSVALEAFWWFCGNTFPSPTLLPAVQLLSGYKLSKWPDFSKLQHTRQQLSMAALLLQKSCVMESLVRGANVTPNEAVNFLNTAFLCGWLQETAVPTPVVPSTPDASPSSGRRGIISRIRERLGLTR